MEGNPLKGGTLIIALGSDSTTLNCGIESSQIVGTVAGQIYSGLIHMDKNSILIRSWLSPGIFPLTDLPILFTFEMTSSGRTVRL